MQRRTRFAALLLGGTLLLVTSACNKYGYEAHIDDVQILDSHVTVTGWLRDPFVAKRPMECAEVWQILDGGSPTKSSDCVNQQRRPDLDAVRGEASFGFSLTAWRLKKGRHEMCVQIVPANAAVPSGSLDCRTFDVKFDQEPASNFDGASVDNGVLTAEAWVKEVKLTSSQGLYHPTWKLDGQWIRAGHTGAVLTLVDRPDVVAAVGFGQGYRISIPVDPGTHRICLGSDDGFGGFGDAGTTDAMCRTVVAP